MSKAIYKFNPPRQTSPKKTAEAIDEAERLKMQQKFDEECQENASAYHQIIQARRRGPTFDSDPNLLEVVVNKSGRIKSLSESCDFDINEIGKK